MGLARLFSCNLECDILSAKKLRSRQIQGCLSHRGTPQVLERCVKAERDSNLNMMATNGQSPILYFYDAAESKYPSYIMSNKVLTGSPRLKRLANGIDL